MKKTNTLLSICTRCRDGREDMHENRGGTRLAEEFMKRATEQIGFNGYSSFNESKPYSSCYD